MAFRRVRRRRKGCLLAEAENKQESKLAGVEEEGAFAFACAHGLGAGGEAGTRANRSFLFTCRCRRYGRSHRAFPRLCRVLPSLLRLLLLSPRLLQLCSFHPRLLSFTSDAISLALIEGPVMVDNKTKAQTAESDIEGVKALHVGAEKQSHDSSSASGPSNHVQRQASETSAGVMQ